MLRNGLLNKIKRADYGDFKSRFRRCFITVIFVFIAVITFAEIRKLTIGENLIFDVYWKFLKVGYGTLEMKGIADCNGRDAYYIYSEAKSAPFFDVFFKVRDENRSWIDVENFHSLAFEQKIREGGYKRDKRTVYDQKEHIAVNEKGESFGIPENVLDVLGALYWVRLQELKPGTTLMVNVNSRNKNYKMNIKVHNKDEIEIGGKTYKTIVIEPDLQDSGIFMQKGAVLIWLSDDEYHIPVKMKSKIAVGSITAELKEKD